MQPIRYTLLASLLVSGYALADGIEVTLSTPSQQWTTQQDVAVTVTLTNTEQKPVKVLRWYTPASDVEEALFEIRRNGESVAYEGAHYKRPAATGADYMTLKPGESVHYPVELSAYYDMGQPGTYQIRYHVSSAHLWTEKPQQDRKAAKRGLDGLVSEPLVLTLDGAAQPLKVTTPAGNDGTISFTGRCSNTQQATILDGLNAARQMATGANQYLQAQSSPADSVRYNTWFGYYDANRYNTVQQHFVNLDSTLQTANMTFDCGCKKSYYAYVYPNQPYKVYLCKAFWSAPLTGTDSKGGTIVHETSHFTVVAGTDDVAYGQTAAKSLAITDPAKAIQNADSHEYFAENTPAQP